MRRVPRSPEVRRLGAGWRPPRFAMAPPGSADRRWSGNFDNTGVSLLGDKGMAPSIFGEERAAVRRLRHLPEGRQAPGLALQAPGHALQAPGHALQAPGLALQAPGHALQAPGHALQAPGLALQAPGLALQAPGHALQAPGHALQAPGVAVQAPGPALQAPSHALQAPCHALQAPGLAFEAPGLAVHAPGLAVHAPGLALQAPGSTRSALPTVHAHFTRCTVHSPWCNGVGEAYHPPDPVPGRMVQPIETTPQLILWPMPVAGRDRLAWRLR